MAAFTLDRSNGQHLDRTSNNLVPIQVIEVAAGPARRRWLEDRVAAMSAGEGDGARSFLVSCDFDMAGPWAGAKELILSVFADIQAQCPHLIDRHSFELTSAAPSLRRRLRVRNQTLTDMASGEEKVRAYPADRALRNAHGLIDLLDSWRSETGLKARWILACDDYDKAGSMSRYFFRELARRRGNQLNLSLLVAVAPGKGKEIGETFASGHPITVTELNLAPQIPVVYGKQEAAIVATELERKIGQDPIEKELHLHELIGLWELAERPDKVLQLRESAVHIYFFAGLYKDALRCGEGLLEMAARYAPEDERLRREIVIRRLNTLISIQDAEACLQLIETEALKLVDRAPLRWQADLFYLTAMVYARYLKPRNFAKGEEYLNRSLAAIEQAGYPEERYHFQSVFNRNGVAMIRSFQQRAPEAIDLCQNGIARLNAHVGADKHRLHRSVLVYNIGQVYLAIGRYEEAIEYYSAAIAMDPNFSEYYNERGSIFLRMDRFEEARADFYKAIDLSPPYFEVFTNLGQCYRNMERYEEAVEAYSRAIDLVPDQSLALLGRARAHETLGNRAAAIADYTSALSLDATQWEALANRGALYYESGDLELALADFNSAIGISPDQVNLYQNRSIVLNDLRRFDEARRDLEVALLLAPTDDDKLLLQHQAATLLEKVSLQSRSSEV